MPRGWHLGPDRGTPLSLQRAGGHSLYTNDGTRGTCPGDEV